MKWWMLAGLQFGLAKIPFGKNIYEYLQNNYGELSNISKSQRFENSKWFINNIVAHKAKLDELHAVEIGTGWVPAIPVYLAMCGIKKVETYDVAPLVKPEHYQQMMMMLNTLEPPPGVDLQLWQHRKQIAKDSKTLSEAMEKMGGSYDAPADTTALPHADNSVDNCCL